MMVKGDHTCEVLALIVLAVLSELSHFWYIMMAIGIVAGVVGAGFLFSKMFLRAQTKFLARFVGPVIPKNTIPSEVPIEIASESGPSLS